MMLQQGFIVVFIRCSEIEEEFPDSFIIMNRIVVSFILLLKFILAQNDVVLISNIILG